MSAATTAPQTNGILPSTTASGAQTISNTPQPSTSQPAPSATPAQSQTPATTQPQQPTSTTTPSPRPRDARTLELLLTAQGVTSFEPRVSQLLLDFAYRHTAAVLSDALHLSADPYVSHAGARPSASSGAAPVNVGEASITANAVALAISSRLGYQFRGGGGGYYGGGGGGASKDWMLELARERNKVALPRVLPSEWGVRLPGERFVLSGVSWGLKDVWAGQEGESEEESEPEEQGDKMEVDENGKNGEAEDGVEVEGGTMEDVFGDEGLEDEEMGEA